MNFPTAEDEIYMQFALEEAARAVSQGEVPVGAVLVYDNEILAKVHNVREAWQDPTAHAEVVAIREAAAKLGTWRLTGASLYSTLEPCAMCAGSIIHARIARLVFGAADPKAGACGSVFNIPAEPRLNHSVSVVRGVCARESHDMLQSFFRSRRERRIPAVLHGWDY
jgi:tRNA(adenine34) deaminase